MASSPYSGPQTGDQAIFGWRTASRLVLAGTMSVMVTGCANPVIRVTTAGDRAAIAGASVVQAEHAATDRLSVQLAKSGVAAVADGSSASRALQLQLTTTSRPGKLSVCAEPAAKTSEPCGRWLVEPLRGVRLFGTPVVHQLTLRFADPASGQVPFQVTASTSRRTKADADLHGKMLDAIIACLGCVGGPLAKPEH